MSAVSSNFVKIFKKRILMTSFSQHLDNFSNQNDTQQRLIKYQGHTYCEFRRRSLFCLQLSTNC